MLVYFVLDVDPIGSFVVTNFVRENFVRGLSEEKLFTYTQMISKDFQCTPSFGNRSGFESEKWNSNF